MKLGVETLSSETFLNANFECPIENNEMSYWKCEKLIVKKPNWQWDLIGMPNWQWDLIGNRKMSNCNWKSGPIGNGEMSNWKRINAPFELAKCLIENVQL